MENQVFLVDIDSSAATEEHEAKAEPTCLKMPLAHLKGNIATHLISNETNLCSIPPLALIK